MRKKWSLNIRRLACLRTGATLDAMAHLYLAPQTDSLYLDVTSGDRKPTSMTEIADGVFLHLDHDGVVVAIEVMDLSLRGGLQADDLDAPDGAARASVLGEIERAAADRANRGARADRGRT
jgi:uncharacterized protein YuzE